MRAYLLQDAGPGAALGRLNELVHLLLPEETATAIVAELEPATGALTVANAGHPPVLLAALAPVTVDDVTVLAFGLAGDAAATSSRS